MSRIVVFGATGYTGRLVTEALLARGARPVLAGRSTEKLKALEAALGGQFGQQGLEVAVADVAAPDSVQALVERGDVLVSTVGPFLRWGMPAVKAAIGAGATYFDSTGEGPFLRKLFVDCDGAARAAGATLVPAFGYDFVPGHLAAGLALRDAGPAGVRVDVGYFVSGRGFGMSSGTQASGLLIATEPAHRFAGGRLGSEPTGRRIATFQVRGRGRRAISIGGTEQLSLPRVHPQLHEVNVHLGWADSMARLAQAGSYVTPLLRKLDAAGKVRNALSQRASARAAGPSSSGVTTSRSHAVAVVYDASGRELATAEVAGTNPYPLTGALLAWGAERALAGEVAGPGVLGPLEAFSLEQLEAGCAEAGLHRVT
jgi:short subunit dehydrogenase-like uncharacterized protein